MDAAFVSEAAGTEPSARRFPWVSTGWLVILIIVLFFPVIVPMVREWMELEEMGHAVFVPVVAGYIVWNERERLLQTPARPCWWAIGLVVWGFLQMLLGFVGADFFVARTALLVSISGVIWTVAGTAVLRKLLFPLLLLAFMIRIPQFLYQQITFPLQILASILAEKGLDLIGIPVLRDGNVLELPTQRLQVVEACSGIRSLLSLTFLSLVYAYMFDRRVWMRWALFFLTIPIAILANAARVTLTGVISQWNAELAEGVYHTMEGWIVFMIALGALVIVHRLICRFVPARA
jgi:exosortase